MGQEFIIKSQKLEDKVNQLLPSQGGFQAGVDLSASTTIIPIVDLTESGEGSTQRQDLQTSLSLTSVTAFSVNNTTSTLVNTTGYFRVFGLATYSGAGSGLIQITDGTTTKRLFVSFGISSQLNTVPYDFNVLLQAGDTLQGFSDSTSVSVQGVTRQIADLAGNLINP
jgi:hypothetical protein